MKIAQKQKTWDWLLLFIINIMWATQVPVIRLMGDRLGPVTIAFVPMILSTILFIPFLWWENRREGRSFRWKWKDLKYFILPGLIGIFLMQYTYTLGSTLTLAANAGIITLTIPVLVAICAAVLLKEKLNIVRIIGFFFALAGVLLTSLSDLSGADFSENKYLSGNIIFFFACCCCGVYNTYCKLLVDRHFTELEILVYSSVIGSIVCIPFLIWVEPFSLSRILHSGHTILFGILELSLVVYGSSMLLFFYILKRMDITQAILGNYLLPFFIALFGIWLLKEKITSAMLIGGGVIIVSTLMVTVYENKLLVFLKKGRQNFLKEKPTNN